jgi:hypothetical protein
MIVGSGNSEDYSSESSQAEFDLLITEFADIEWLSW